MKTITKSLILLFLISSCGGGGDDAPSSPEPKGEESKVLGAFDLIFPDNNLICTEGEDMDNDQVEIAFLWEASTNATSYSLEIKNQETGEITNATATVPEKRVILKKDTQFSWSVTAVLDDKSKKSTQWNFYSEGIAEENSAPFPADISVSDNKDGTVKIDWPSSDLDDDIESYDIYFGTEPEPEIAFSAVTYTSLSAQPISYNTTYYIKVVVNDSRGNAAISKKEFKFEL